MARPRKPKHGGNSLLMDKHNDNRNVCQFCGTKTWSKDYAGFMRDHDRADGKRCVRAARVYEAAIRVPSWAKVAS